MSGERGATGIRCAAALAPVLAWVALSPAVVAALFSRGGALAPATVAALLTVRAVVACGVALGAASVATVLAPPRWLPAHTVARLRTLGGAAAAMLAGAGASALIAEAALRLGTVNPERPAAAVALYRSSADPRLTYELVPDTTLACRGVTYRTNAAGFRGGPWPAAPVKALLVGDSLVYGDEVREEDLVSSRLQALLGGPVVGAGVGGYGTFQERRLVEVLAPRLRPERVILMFSYNDVDDPHRHLKVSRPLPFLPEALPVPVPPAPEPPPWSAADLADLVARRVSRLYVAFRIAYTRLTTPRAAAPAGHEWEHCLVDLGRPDSARARWLARELTALGALSRSLHTPVVVALAPLRYQLPPESLYADAPRRTVAALCREAGLGCLDLFPEFEKNGGERLFVDTGHFSAEGHRVAAAALARVR